MKFKLDPRGLPPSGERALIGVSGGRDSVALLHGLVKRGECELIVVHFDHRWREESAADAEFVRDLAHSMNLQCEIGKAASKAAKHHEASARKLRYAFFAKAAKKRGCTNLILAHHADDQAETFLFNILRGAGSAGLCGMRPRSEMKIGKPQLTIFRPLLVVWREEIDRYISANQLMFCEDETNAETAHTRNRLRHELIPMIEQSLGRKVREALWRAAEIAGEEEALLASQVPQFAANREIDLRVLRELAIALQRRAIYAWLRRSGVPEVDFADVENVMRLVTQRSPAKVNLSAGWHARRRAGVVFLEAPMQIGRDASPRRP